jgi:hypothetical protein
LSCSFLGEKQVHSDGVGMGLLKRHEEIALGFLQPFEYFSLSFADWFLYMEG